MSQNNFLFQRSSDEAPKLRNYALHWISIMMLAIALTACGGGGSSGGSAPATTGVTPITPTDPGDPMPPPVDPGDPPPPQVNEQALLLQLFIQ